MKTILVIRFSSLGDLITQDIAYRAIRHFYRDSNIVFLTSNIGVDLYHDSLYFNDFVVFDSVNIFKVISSLRQHHFDVVFDLHSSSASLFLGAFVNSKMFLYQSSNWWQKVLQFKPRPRWYLELLELSGIDSLEINEYIKTKDNSIIHLPYVKKSYDWQDTSKKTIAVAIGASERWESKKWGDEHYLELINILIKQGYIVVLIGSKPEIELGRKIEQQNSLVVNLIAKTSLSELKSVLAVTNLLVGNDSGPAHLAAGVGTNTLTIFGSTDIKHCVKFGSYLGGHEYLVAEPRLSCQPCYKPICPTNKECMSVISVDKVYKTIIGILEGEKNA